MTSADMDEPVVVYTGSFAMAGLLMSQLEDAGIKADVWNAAVSTLVALTLQTKVVVAQRDIVRAGPIVEQFIQKQSEEGSEQSGKTEE